MKNNGHSHGLGAREAAQLLNRSLQAIYMLTHERKIPFRKCGRCLQFDEKELRAWAQHANTTVTLDEALENRKRRTR